MANLKREEEREMSIEEILASIRRYVGEEPENPVGPSSLDSKPEHFPYTPSRSEADKTAEDLAASLSLSSNKERTDNLRSSSPYHYPHPDSEPYSKEAPYTENVIRLTEAYAPKEEPQLSQLNEKVILSPQAQSATTQSFSRLAEAAMKPKNHSPDNNQIGLTLEQFIREMAQPLVKQWLDQNLPRLVELTVTKEIERLSRQFSRDG